MNFSDPQVLRRYVHLCNEIAFINEKSALIRTEVASEVWAHELAEEYSKDQDAVVTEVRWRQSRLGGKFWATPPISGQQSRAARRQRQRRKAPMDLGDNLEVNARLTGTGCGNPERALRSVVGLLAGEFGLAEVDADADLNPGNWKFLDTGLWGGEASALKILARDRQAVESIVSALHGKSVKVGATAFGVEASSDANLEAEAKNVCGRVARRGCVA